MSPKGSGLQRSRENCFLFTFLQGSRSAGREEPEVMSPLKEAKSLPSLGGGLEEGSHL